MTSPLRALILVLSSTVLAAVLAASRPANAAETPVEAPARVRSVEGVDEYRLANGLQVLLIADDSKPTTTVNLTFRVGSRHESYGETGMAHLLEHMLFKGTPTHRNVWSEFTKRGLAANGTTWLDRTNYHAKFSADEGNLAWYLGWLADAMVASDIARKDLDTEMTVVRNEMESGENRPGRILTERTMSAMFDWHNYGHSTIGARADVENVDIPRLQAFYRLYYQPDNATLVVAGKFDPPRTLAAIAAAFGPVPKPARSLPRLYTLDPAQDGERSVVLRRVGGAPLLQAGYHVPAGPAKETAAVELLTIVLGDTPSGRLYQRLTRAQLAAGVSSESFVLADPGVLFVGAQLAPGQDVERARAALIATTEGVAAAPVTEEELARAKRKWLNDWDAAFTNPETVGIAMSEAIAQGDWRLFFLLRDRVRDARLPDVQAVAERYLVADNRTLGTYLPTDTPVRAPKPVRVDLAQALADFKPQAAAAVVAAFEATPANIDARTQTVEIGGVKAALLPKPTRGGAVSAVLTLRFGDEASLAGSARAAQALATLLDKGTRTMSRQQVQDRLDALRTEVSIGAAPGRVTVSIGSRRETFAAAIELVGELLREPSLPPEALDEYRRAALSAIEQQRKDPRGLATLTLDRLGNPYPRGDVRYRATFEEAAAEVAALKVDDLRAFHDRFYGCRHGEFAAVGDFDPAAVRAALASALRPGARPDERFARVPQPLVPVAAQRIVLPTPDKPNATMLVRLPLPLVDTDPDYPALLVGNQILGGGGSSRLWRRIREVEGLSYDVRSGVDWASLDRNSPWQASAIFAPQNRPRVEAAFREEVARLLKDGVAEQELREARQSLLNYRQLSRAQDRGVATTLASNLYLGRTFALQAQVDAAIARLTVDEVNAALRRFLAPDAFVTVFAGDFKAEAP